MRNICNVDLRADKAWGSYSSGANRNELILEIIPLDSQKTNYRIEVIKSGNSEKITSDAIEKNGGIVYYTVPSDCYKDAGAMRVRLLSNEGNSEQVLFVVAKELKNGDNIQAKYDVDTHCFDIFAIATVDYELPIASETTLGGIKVGNGLEIEADGTLNNTGVPGPKGDKGDQGPIGPKGDKGDTGSPGKDGLPNILRVGTVEDGPVAQADITGDTPNQVLNLVLPKGDTGADGKTPKMMINSDGHLIAIFEE